MKYFPENLESKNKLNFPQINYSRIKCYLRRDLYDHIISKEESEYFDLDDFSVRRLKNKTLLDKMVGELCIELENIGWCTGISFGGTGLFIYKDRENPPKNYYPDGLEQEI